jgi:hypothetical protein
MADSGYLLLPGVYSAEQVDAMIAELQRIFAGQDDAIRSDAGTVYAARNILELWPAAASIWRQPPLPAALAELLGVDFGLVRVLYFDKPPERTWTLPWHKDLTIAVRNHRLPSERFHKPTRKAGVPHVEAPREVLERMATLRIHLDEVTEENGPLEVVPGSHHTGKELKLGDTRPVSVLAGRGDVLLMRPLLAHASGRSHPETRRHRRILHLEFAADRQLPDQYQWYHFVQNR